MMRRNDDLIVIGEDNARAAKAKSVFKLVEPGQKADKSVAIEIGSEEKNVTLVLKEGTPLLVQQFSSRKIKQSEQKTKVVPILCHYALARGKICNIFVIIMILNI